MRTTVALALALAALIGPPRPGVPQDSLATAKTLYQSAAYDEALVVLDRLKASPPAAAPEAQAVAQYRAYCLLALNRQPEAERAIEDVVVGDPFFVPPDTDTSPRVRAAFQTVRRRALPALVQQEYAAAKATFERKEYAAAADQFERVSALLRDPDIGDAPPIGDLRVLAAGFLDLARAAIPPPPPPPAADPPPAPTPPVSTAPKIYDASDAGVTPPVVKRQDLPRWPTTVAQKPSPLRLGVLDVVIDETGRVVTATLRQAIDPRYDGLLLASVRAWQYVPAMRDGQPVKFLKRLQVVVQ